MYTWGRGGNACSKFMKLATLVPCSDKIMKDGEMSFKIPAVWIFTTHQMVYKCYWLRTCKMEFSVGIKNSLQYTWARGFVWMNTILLNFNILITSFWKLVSFPSCTCCCGSSLDPPSNWLAAEYNHRKYHLESLTFINSPTAISPTWTNGQSNLLELCICLAY